MKAFPACCLAWGVLLAVSGMAEEKSIEKGGHVCENCSHHFLSPFIDSGTGAEKILLIGTDSGIPSMFHTDSTWREMALWVELGVSAMETIQAATLWPARFLGVEDDLGTLAPGRLADVIAVRGDPLTRMSALRDVDVVIKNGERVR